MAKEKEHESTKRCGEEGVSGRTRAQDRQKSGRGQAQPGRGERCAHLISERRSCAGDSPRVQPGLTDSRGKTRPPGRISRAKPLQVAALAGWLLLQAGCGSHRKPVT